MRIAIIGGTGVYDLGTPGVEEWVATPYGDAAVLHYTVEGREVLFVPRHGVGHALPPHRVNYRANIWALRALGVTEVVATQAVGSLDPHMKPGDFVLLSQFIDWTKARPSTFFDGEHGVVRHVDVTKPYCGRVIGKLLRAGEFLQEQLHGTGVYACTEGPRFETAAEIAALRVLGAEVVGMTSVPEVVLAREAGLCYAGVSIVCNWGAGMTSNPLTQQEVVELMAEQTGALQRLLRQYLALPPAPATCDCAALGFGDDLPSLVVAP